MWLHERLKIRNILNTGAKLCSRGFALEPDSRPDISLGTCDTMIKSPSGTVILPNMPDSDFSANSLSRMGANVYFIETKVFRMGIAVTKILYCFEKVTFFVSIFDRILPLL